MDCVCFLFVAGWGGGFYMCFVSKLDGVGLVDNRPSNNKLHHYVKKKCDKLHWTHDI